jgi:pimeloyl-ACP methyl ester carboxylesterase
LKIPQKILLGKTAVASARIENALNRGHGDAIVSRIFCLFIVCAAWQPAETNGHAASQLEGSWVGACQIGGKDVFLRVRLETSTAHMAGSAFSRMLDIRNAPLAVALAQDGRLFLSFVAPRGPIQLTCEVHENEMKGTITTGASKGPCFFQRRVAMDTSTFDPIQGDYQVSPNHVVFIGRYDIVNYFFLVDGDRRVEIVPVGPHDFLSEDLRHIRVEQDEKGAVSAITIAPTGLAPQRAPRVRLYEQEPVTFTNGDVRLAGQLTMPRSPAPCPALVFVHGSGPGTRSTYVIEADLFARHGFASLSFDKRGCRESGGDWRQVDFDVLADDVLAAVQCLRHDRRIRADKVGLFGVSQAGWIIPLAASRSADVAFIVPVSGAAVSPAEQELWRQRQNLQFLHMPERFIELERKAAIMAYDWQRQNQLGRMPIPNYFIDDNLKMFHDAPAVLRRVRQPVLAIFGGKDTLTPAHESAAIWANILRQRGDDDFSVRLFPTGTHGLLVSEKTGCPLELLPEIRWVPGYADTIVKWIHHHVEGPPFPQARQIDIDSETIPIEARGMQQISWYGSGLVQSWQLAVFLVLFASAALATPAAAVWRRLRPKNSASSAGSRRTLWLAAFLGLANVSVLLAMTYVLYQLVQAQPNPLFAHLASVWNGIALATWLSFLLVVLVVRGCILAWRQGSWSRSERVFCALVAVAGLAWLPFAFYWDLLWTAW